MTAGVSYQAGTVSCAMHLLLFIRYYKHNESTISL